MPFPNSSASPNPKFKDSEHLPAVEIDELLTRLQHSHALYYKMMNLEVWSLVETLDQLFPGSWGRFMTNRKIAMKQFLQRQQAKNGSVDASVFEDLEKQEATAEFSHLGDPEDGSSPASLDSEVAEMAIDLGTPEL
ncbi:MAG: hypothetical protein ACM37W_26600 [Actinomycetota bacterium]